MKKMLNTPELVAEYPEEFLKVRKQSLFLSLINPLCSGWNTFKV
jgi:hypothetical protein